MTIELYIALFIFAFVSVITPGPNNLMLMASGLNFGWQRTLPHMIGVGLGFPLMLLLVGLGLVQVFESYPLLKQIMTVLSIIYLLYLAWSVANASTSKEGTAAGRPLTFFQAAAFQWVNPKAWSMALTALTVYVPVDMGWKGALLAAVTYVACAVISTNTWTILGAQVRRLINKPCYQRTFNWICATILVATLYPAISQYFS